MCGGAAALIGVLSHASLLLAAAPLSLSGMKKTTSEKRHRLPYCRINSLRGRNPHRHLRPLNFIFVWYEKM